MGRVRSVERWVQLRQHQMSAGFTSFGLRSAPEFSLDPFLNVDDFRMSVPTFPPHPHAGFSAVTYLFEDSAGAFTNRDSLGDASIIAPGGLHWTQAARGMMHEEIPQTTGVESHGLQIFVNLRSDHKAAPPRAFHLEPKDIPEVSAAGARVRVLTGSYQGVSSSLTELLTPTLMLDVHLAPRAAVTIPIPPGFQCFVLGIDGEGTLGGERPLPAHAAATFHRDGEVLQLAAGPNGLHLLVAGGPPLDEPVLFGGPFAMTNAAELSAAQARFRRGEMGTLEPSF